MKKKGISPVIASIILIAITVAVAIAVAGWVFGIFGGATTYAKVTLVSASYDGSTGSDPDTGKIIVVLTNTGTATTSVFGGSVTVGGATITLPTPTTDGPLPPGETVTFTYEDETLVASAGLTYALDITLADGSHVYATGTVS